MGIQVSIHAGHDKESSTITAAGIMLHIITDKERSTFGIDDNALKQAVETYFGQRPTDAYLHSPTPWGDLYQSYNWSQVQTVLNVKNATILEITSEPTIIATKSFTNNSDKPATFIASITDEVSNTSTSSWSQTDTVSFEQSVSYEISFLGTGAGGETTLSYSHEWGREDSESKTVTVGSESGVSVDLGPNESVEVQLSASRGVMKAVIEYEATLTGVTALNYESKYKDHHFWGLDIHNVMRAAGIPLTQTFTETIEIGYYDSSKIVLIGPTDGQKVSFSLPHPLAVPS
ncbi:follicular epithelium yolk protein subunit [Paenibacillus sp. 1001270B_150601_E10]|uniref:follicular epithelium yolk protein subunit n=1 Tax=Paenibacillus sp. 1001270B_150601_E10 TaxID=2787079 RepID=UPI00189D5BA7|nr:follicular epithelium yolk protein subunit [Paenibacillus sp. 1001270B_150601_E10]